MRVEKEPGAPFSVNMDSIWHNHFIEVTLKRCIICLEMLLELVSQKTNIGLTFFPLLLN